MSAKYFFYLVAAIHWTCGDGITYIAKVDMAGYSATVTLQQNGDDMDVNVSFKTGVNVDLFDTYAITSIPPIFGRLNAATEVCNYLGSTVQDIYGATDGSVVTVSNISPNEIFNRGLLITSSSPSVDLKLCGVILPDGDVSTYHAKFIGPVVGEVWIRTRSSTPGLFVLSDLSYSKALNEPQATSNLTLTGYTDGSIDDSSFATRCRFLTTPTTFSYVIPVGNSASSQGKMNTIFVADVSTAGNVLGLFQPESDTVSACADLYELLTKTVVARISWDNIRGTIQMAQRSPFDATTIIVSLNGISVWLTLHIKIELIERYTNDRITNESTCGFDCVPLGTVYKGLDSSTTSLETPAEFHVHEYPVPQRLDEDDQRCSGTNVGGHFNPYEVIIADSPDAGMGTSDQYELGDLSGKYGKLENESVNRNFTDWNLPLFGVHSVVGRSIVVHFPNGSRWVCANIRDVRGVITAVARFKEPAYGSIYFQQPIGDVNGDISIFGKLANMDDLSSKNHNYHIHAYPVGSDCASAGPHYDPTGLSESKNYMDICSAENPFQCEMGDLSGRHAGLDIGARFTHFFVTDSNMRLLGSYSIIGLSVVIHDKNADGSRYACANITKVWTTTVRTADNTWRGDDDDGTVTGHITLSQDTEYDRTNVVSSVTGLNSIAEGYHIHVLPIPSNATGLLQCSGASVQGHYNPFNIPTIEAATLFTYDKYEVGDLSSKYGTLDGSNVIESPSMNDNNLPITSHGVNAAGRSFVIHKADDSATRWKCNSIELQPSSLVGHVITAEASFTGPSVFGQVTMRQVVYEDGFSTVTNVLVALLNAKEESTLNHNWHIHVDPVLHRNDCYTALDIYDPYMAFNRTRDYSSQCNGQNPLSCRVGDLSKKLGQYSIDNITRLYTDGDLPLHTHRTVLGRSITFDEKNGGDQRMACANILPKGNTFTLAYPSSVEYDYYRLTEAVATSLNVSRMRVVVLHNVDVPVTDYKCSKVMIHIAGDVNENRLDDLIEGTATGMFPFISTDECKSENGATVLGQVSTAGENASQRLTVNFEITLATSILSALLHTLLC